MMKKTIHLLALGVLVNAGVYAQSVEDGVKAYYNGNYASAINILEKQATNPEAAYWLAESYFELQKNEKANQVVTSALAANANNPLLLAAKGQGQLTENKPADAMQSFNAAIAAAGKKDADQASVLNAVGHAISKEYNNIDKIGDINYAVQKLEAAKATESGIKEKNQDKRLLADINTNLADATLKANPGDGSRAFTLYLDALTAEPTFAKAEYRKAMIFKSQRNSELYLESLNKAISINPAYVPAYDELVTYYTYGTPDFKQAQVYADKMTALLPPGPNNDYAKALSAYYTKNFPEAINIGKGIISKAGDQTNPQVYKLIAYSLIESKDTAAAIPYVDDYFKNQTKEGIVPKDYILKGIAYSTTPGKEAEVVQTYIDAAAADTTIAGKVDLLETGAKSFADAGKNALAGELYSKILEVKPADKITINDYFNAGYYGYYKAGEYENAWKIFDAMRTKFPKQNYGYMWAYNSSKAFDTTNAQNKMIPDGDKYIAFLQSPDDTSAATTKRPEIFKTATAMAIFYANVKKDNANALKYLHTAYDNADDPAAKDQIGGYIKAMGGTPGNPNAAPTSSATKPKGGK